MYALYIVKVGDINAQIEPVYNPYKHSLDNILDRNINNIILKKVYTKSRLG